LASPSGFRILPALQPTQHTDMYTTIAQCWRQMNGAHGKSGLKRIADEQVRRSPWMEPIEPDHMGVTWNCERTPTIEAWRASEGLGRILDLDGAQARRVLRSPTMEHSSHFPMVLVLDGVERPAVAVTHHMAHAACAFFQSPFDQAGCLSLDNGMGEATVGYRGGMMFLGSGHTIRPIWRADLACGLIYMATAQRLGLGRMAGPGKLMGLASYGEAEFYDQRFVGDASTVGSALGVDLYTRSRCEGWFEHIRRIDPEFTPEHEGPAFSRLGKNIAASTQRIFEESLSIAVSRMGELLLRGGLSTDALCLSGGCALNCPTNSRLENEGHFSRLFVPPSCDDGGLSIGAALFVHHHVLEHPRIDRPNSGDNQAMLGRDLNPHLPDEQSIWR